MTSASFGRSIARFALICAAVCGAAHPACAADATPSEPSEPSASSEPSTPPPYAAWQGSAHAPPPPIALGAPPAPELAPPEYARRPFELTAELLLGFPSCSDGSEDNARCDALGPGGGLGMSALWRVSPYFAFGGAVSALSFGFNPRASSSLRGGSASGTFYGLLGRVYFADRGAVEPYLELGVGGAASRTRARESDSLSYSESTTGDAVRVGGGVELYLGRHVRLGPAFDWTRLRTGQLERCDAAQACAGLDQDKIGHGVGFTTFSLRLTIAIGPGL